MVGAVGRNAEAATRDRNLGVVPQYLKRERSNRGRNPRYHTAEWSSSSMHPATQPDTATSPEGPRVDLGKLKTTSLKKYVRMYCPEETPHVSKDELTRIVERHWDENDLDEDWVMQQLLLRLKNRGPTGQ